MPLTHHDGDLDIYSEITVTGDVSGQITVRSGGVLVLLGVAEAGVVVTGGGFARIVGTTHGLRVAAGGRAVLAGTCVGEIVNDGGELTVETHAAPRILDLRESTVAGHSGFGTQ